MKGEIMIYDKFVTWSSSLLLGIFIGNVIGKFTYLNSWGWWWICWPLIALAILNLFFAAITIAARWDGK